MCDMYLVSGPGREDMEVPSIEEVIKIAVCQPVYRNSDNNILWSEQAIPGSWPLPNSIDIDDLPQEIKSMLS